MLIVKACAKGIAGIGILCMSLSAMMALVSIFTTGEVDAFAPFPSPWGPPLPTLFLFGVGFLILGVMLSYFERALRIS